MPLSEFLLTVDKTGKPGRMTVKLVFDKDDVEFPVLGGTIEMRIIEVHEETITKYKAE